MAASTKYPYESGTFIFLIKIATIADTTRPCMEQLPFAVTSPLKITPAGAPLIIEYSSHFSLLFSFYYHLISGKIYDCGAHLPPAFYNNKPIIWYENGHGFYSFFKKYEIFFVFCCITPKTGIVYCLPPHIRFQCDFSGHKKTSGILQLRKSYFCSAITAIRR